MLLADDTQASVTKTGAVLLGNYVACDAFDANRPLRIVTHAHGDHLGGLRKSIKHCEKVIMTPATRDLAEIVNPKFQLQNNNILTLEYGKPFRYNDDETITLLKADHIMGASQVLVETANGTRIVYTGDFKLEGTPVIDCDILVVEATYGNPSCRRNFDVNINELLVAMIERRLRGGTVYVFGFYGKLQEVMHMLRKADVEVPFVMPDTVHEVSKVCDIYGMNLGSLTLDTSNEGQELLDSNLPCVAFYHTNSRFKVGLNHARICVSGWEFQNPCRQINEHEYLVALSDHSDFDNLIEYVKRSKAKQVITDNYRSTHGKALADEITKRIGVPAVAQPLGKGQTTLL
ncbi:MAG: MBL fold metallo-hydrolase [Candidatus Bathyarchaeota archaeon]|nr:MBL fold metallo-hydrolase [Candidatus Termiticorpusculum sp.]